MRHIAAAASNWRLASLMRWRLSVCCEAMAAVSGVAIVIGQRGVVKLQTTAHSPTGFAVEAGFLDEREALHHEERHLVSNFIGTNDMRIDVGAAVELDLRDTVLVASDGLMDNVHVDEIIDIVRKGPLSDAVRALVDIANQRMKKAKSGEPSKPDDLSVILFRKPD